MPSPDGNRPERFRRSRAARARRQAPDRLGGAILVLTIVLGVALVGFLAYAFTALAA